MLQGNGRVFAGRGVQGTSVGIGNAVTATHGRVQVGTEERAGRLVTPASHIW